jgi:hypothetical protein
VPDPPPPPPSAPWTTPPTAPPPAWSPPAPRRRSRPWIWLLVGVFVVIIGLAVASGTIWIQKVKPPIDAANDYLGDLSRGEYEAGFDRLCAAEQVDASPESLARLADQVRINDYEVSPFDVNRDGSRATVKVDLSPDTVGGRSARLRLQEIGGEWRPCGGQLGFVRLPSLLALLT